MSVGRKSAIRAHKLNHAYSMLSIVSKPASLKKSVPVRSSGHPSARNAELIPVRALRDKRSFVLSPTRVLRTDSIPPKWMHVRVHRRTIDMDREMTPKTPSHQGFWGHLRHNAPGCNGTRSVFSATQFQCMYMRWEHALHDETEIWR